MYREGICGLRILKCPESRVVIENMYFALREPSDAVTMTFDAIVDANRFLLLAGKEARCQVILIENCLIICISARDLRHGGDRQKFELVCESWKCGMRGSESRVIRLACNTMCSSRPLHNGQLIYHQR